VLKKCGGVFDIAGKQKEIEQLSAAMGDEKFWENQTEAQKIVEKLKGLKKIVEPWTRCRKDLQELKELLTLTEDTDEKTVQELGRELERLKKEVDTLELSGMLSDPVDSRDAIISINAGAGGTESCDWVDMLLRMYTRWAESRSFRIEMIDYLAGEEAGVKNVTFFVHGFMAYGYLRSEIGVHRLVRISPFDSNKRRHTSFASVDVIAESEEEGEIEINPADLRIDTYRAGGAGGQHVNKTESAVRITHEPSGIVVQCQNERSQHKNRVTAMRVLRSRLLEARRREEEKKMKKHHGEKKEIAWGSQIRSYVFQPYQMVKDHRTNFETSNVQQVMDGDLDGFMESFLRQQASYK